jgi:hypothetical protein
MKKIITSLCALFLGATALVAQDCNCFVDLDSTFQIVPMSSGVAPEYRNDDSFSAPITLPFNFQLYGASTNVVYINNNGNVSINGGYSAFTASGFPIANFPMVASFWGDVDTRDSLSGLVHYKITDHALIVRYNNVGYFSSHGDLLNDFQLVISDGLSPLVPDGQNIAFCYGDMQWTTGDASNGDFGFGGSPANVGANAGDGVNCMQIGLFNQAGDAYDGPYNLADGIDYLDYSNIYFSTSAASTNQYPVDVTQYCDTIFGAPGDTLAFFWFDDIVQNLTYDVIDSSGVLDPIDSISGMVVFRGEAHAMAFGTIRTGQDHSLGLVVSPFAQDGIYPFAITTTDDGEPALGVTSNYVLKIGEASPTGIAKNPAAENFVTYINNGQLQFKGVDANKVQQLEIFSQNGQKIFQSNRLVNSISVDSWSNGVYMVKLRTSNGVYVSKFMK